MVSHIVVVSRNPTGPVGATQLLAESLLSVSPHAGTAHRALDLRDALDVARELADPENTVVFTQEEGFLSRSYRDDAISLLESGVMIVELNVFNMPSRHRPDHPRYIMACYTREGYWRYRLRSLGSFSRSHPNVALLPNPSRFTGTNNVGQARATSSVRWLRVGRPDFRKWSRWEERFVARISGRGKAEHHLTLLGSPFGEPPKDLGGSQVDVLDYSINVEDVFRDCQAMVHFCPIGETFGNVLLEAKDLRLFVLVAVDPKWECGPLAFLDQASSLVATRNWIMRHTDLVEAQVLSYISRKEPLALAEPTRKTPHEYMERLGTLRNGAQIDSVDLSASSMTCARLLVSFLRQIHGIRFPWRYPVVELVRGLRLRFSRMS